jgi:hypothetical protein
LLSRRRHHRVENLECCLSTNLAVALARRERPVRGHEDQFRPPSANGCCRFGQATFARTHGNGRDAL